MRFLIVVGNILILCMLLLQGCSSSGKSADTLSDNLIPDYITNLSKTSADSGGPLMAFDARGNITVAWLEDIPKSGSTMHNEIYAASSEDQGVTFSAAVSKSPDKEVLDFKNAMDKNDRDFYLYRWMTNSVTISNRPEVLLSDGLTGDKLISPIEVPAIPARDMDIALGEDGSIHLAWSEGNQGAGNIYYRRSADHGLTLSDPIKVLDPIDMDSDAPLLSAEGSMIANIVWGATDNTTGIRNIRFSRTTDGGGHFSDPLTLSPDQIDSYCPQIAKDEDGNIYAAWAGTTSNTTDIYLTSSSDGVNFTDVVNVGTTHASCPQMTIGYPGEIYLAWEESSEIYFSQLINEGKTFSPPLNISRSVDGLSSHPRIAFDRPRYINIAWEEQSGTQKEIYFSGSSNSGASFSKPENISTTSGDSTQPVIGVNEKGDVYFAWTDDTLGNKEIFFRTTPGARSFKKLENDLNGDGYSDIVIGAPGVLYNKGKVYVYFGGPNGPQESPSLTISGTITKGGFGTSISLGDINGDGRSDLLVGATGSECEGGKAYLFWGRTTEEWGKVASVENADVTFSGEGTDCFGKIVAIDGDVNNDGYNDILIGAPYGYGILINSGQAYLFYGEPALKQNYSYNEGSFFPGENAGDHFGSAISYAGDINRDDYTDFLIGAPNASNNSGKVYVYYGGLNSVTRQDNLTLQGNEGEFFGVAISKAGDINRDSFADFLIGADSGGIKAGRVFLYYGGENWKSNSPVIIEGLGKDRFGYSIDSIGDVDNKGYDDFLIGAPWGGFKNTGVIYLFLGEHIQRKSGYPDLSVKSTDLELLGEDKLGELGIDVSGIGDVNGDGIPDWMTGADLGGDNDSGVVYFYPGGSLSDLTPVIISGETRDDQFGKVLNKDILQ